MLRGYSFAALSRGLFFAPVAAGLILTGCGGGDSSPTPSPTSSNSPPSISGGAINASVAENTSGAVFTVTASDPDGDSLSYALGGEDASAFAIDANGSVSFATAPNFDLPRDADHDNTYRITVTVSDGKASASVEARIVVENEREGVAVARVVSFADPGALVVPVAGAEQLLVVNADGTLIQFDPAASTQSVIGNIFAAGETGRVLAAAQDRSWIFVMIAIDGKGTFVRFQHATNSSVSRPTPMLASATDAAATGSLFRVGGLLKAALGDPTGDRAQLAGNGFGKLFNLNFDPYCGASLLSVCLTADIVGSGIHQPEGGGTYDGLAFLFDRGTDQQDEVTYFNPEARPLDFGWPAREGTHVRTSNPPAAVNGPFLIFERGSGFGRAGGLVGGALYDGPIASLKDKLIFADQSGKILAAPVSFMTDGILHSGFEVEDRSQDFAPASGTISAPKAVIRSQGGTLFILDANGDLYKLG